MRLHPCANRTLSWGSSEPMFGSGSLFNDVERMIPRRRVKESMTPNEEQPHEGTSQCPQSPVRSTIADDFPLAAHAATSCSPVCEPTLNRQTRQQPEHKFPAHVQLESPVEKLMKTGVIIRSFSCKFGEYHIHYIHSGKHNQTNPDRFPRSDRSKVSKSSRPFQLRGTSGEERAEDTTKARRHEEWCGNVLNRRKQREQRKKKIIRWQEN